jgi:hypothetical protein
MEQNKQMRSPYKVEAEHIEKESLELCGKLEQIIAAIEQMWSFGEVL